MANRETRTSNAKAPGSEGAVMGERTKIQWADHTFSPWIGCSPAHVGCDHCYAAAMAGRLGVIWGTNGTRRRTAESTWKRVAAWNQRAAGAVERPRVFASLCDPFEEWSGPIETSCNVILGRIGRASIGAFDRMTMDDVRREFFGLVDQCEHLDFLLLTKRPKNVRNMWPSAYWMMDGRGRRRDNVWLIYSASDQPTLEDGLPHLLACRDLAPVLGLSLEPLVARVDLYSAWRNGAVPDWVIVGGESGPNSVRRLHLDWIRSIIDQCRQAGVACFVKQLGRFPVWKSASGDRTNPNYCEMGWAEKTSAGIMAHHAGHIHLGDRKGGDPDEWPEDLRVRELPIVD